MVTDSYVVRILNNSVGICKKYASLLVYEHASSEKRTEERLIAVQTVEDVIIAHVGENAGVVAAIFHRLSHRLRSGFT